jgi:hypothetical protein
MCVEFLYNVPSTLKLGFDLISIPVGFVVNEVVKGQVSLPVLRVCPVNIIPLSFILIYNSSSPVSTSTQQLTASLNNTLLSLSVTISLSLSVYALRQPGQLLDVT